MQFADPSNKVKARLPSFSGNPRRGREVVETMWGTVPNMGLNIYPGSLETMGIGGVFIEKNIFCPGVNVKSAGDYSGL